jgi:N-methylhydantoinase A
MVPRDPGVGSAVGFLHAPISFEIVKSNYTSLDDLDADRINRFLDALQGEGEVVVRAGAPSGPLVTRRVAFMRYHGQGHEIEIPLPDRALTASDIELLRGAFEAEYSNQFSRAVPGMTIEILNWAVSVSTVPAPVTPVGDGAGQAVPEPDGRRTILCDVISSSIDVPVYLRDRLAPGHRIAGPALVIEPQTTTLVSADFDAGVDGAGNLLLWRNDGESEQ